MLKTAFLSGAKSNDLRKNCSADQKLLYRNFLRARDGNIAILFVFMATMLFLFVGGAVDYSRWNAVRADMIQSMDAASLALAQYLKVNNDDLTDAEIQDYGERFFHENFGFENQMLPGAEITFTSDDVSITACVTGALRTHLLGVAGIKKLDVDKCVEITKSGAGRIELALVLDVTGSMGSNGKLQDLRDAVTELLDVLFGDNPVNDNVRIGVVPFNQHVNAGGADSWEDGWGDLNAESFYHGKRFFHVDETGAVQAATKVNHYRLYDSIPNHAWGGCVEARPYPLDELDTPPGQATQAAIIDAAMASIDSDEEPDDTMRDAFSNTPSLPHGLTSADVAAAANSRFVPVFLGDTTDCNSYKECENSNDKDDDSGTVGGLDWEGWWYRDPDSDNDLTWVRESDYEQNRYQNNQYYLVGDREITYRDHNSVGFDHYLPVLRYFRDVVSDTISDPDFDDWMEFNRVSTDQQEYIVRMGYVGWWNPVTNTYEYKYEWAQSSGSPNPMDCPEPILPLTNVRNDIDGGDGSGGVIGDLTARGLTNIPIGAVWGWRVVSPDAPFTESIGPGELGPDNTTEDDWQRAVVIMTDGNNDFYGEDTHWGSAPSAFGYEFEERMGDNVSRADGHSSGHGHAGSERRMESEADNKLLRICRRMKQDNILVYTVVFDVGFGSSIENVFKSCATEPNAPYFFNAPDGEELENAFRDIAADLVDLHVSQ